MATFGDRLREERAKLGLNQTDFAALGHVTKTAQLNYEKGERSPDADYLSALLPHGVDVHFLLTGVPKDQAGAGLTTDQAELLRVFYAINPEGRKAALLVLNALAKASD